MSSMGLIRCGGRLFAATMLAVLLTGLPLPLPSTGLTERVGISVAQAQGGMDVSILTPSFSQLPRTVHPGEQFTIGALTAAGAQCVGTLEFRDHPVIELSAMPAPGGECAWTVDVPPTVRPSTGIIMIDLSKGGQSWQLAGTLWVSVVGENRQ
jgi:hypothetical protein